MSAFMCNDKHLSLLAFYYTHIYRHPTRHDAREVGAILWAKNKQAMQEKYGERCEEFGEYRYRATQEFYALCTPVQAIKACQCYEYQACEAADYEESEAGKIVATILGDAISRLHGYEEAQWEVT